MATAIRTTELRDWEALRMEYLTGDYISIPDFAKKKGIYENTVYYHAGDWDRLRQIAQSGDKIKLMDKEHIEIADKLLKRGKEFLVKHKFKLAKDALNAVELGVKIKRAILQPKGIDTTVHVIWTTPLPRPDGKFITTTDIKIPMIEQAGRQAGKDAGQDVIDITAGDIYPLADVDAQTAPPPPGIDGGGIPLTDPTPHSEAEIYSKEGEDG